MKPTREWELLILISSFLNSQDFNNMLRLSFRSHSSSFLWVTTCLIAWVYNVVPPRVWDWYFWYWAPSSENCQEFNRALRLIFRPHSCSYLGVATCLIANVNVNCCWKIYFPENENYRFEKNGYTYRKHRDEFQLSTENLAAGHYMFKCYCSS